MFLSNILSIGMIMMGFAPWSPEVPQDLRGINENVEQIVSDMNKEILDVDIDIWNCLFAVLAFAVGVFAAVYDWKGYKASKRTADNVARVTEEVQVAQFNDLVRHFHRNLICSLAMSLRQVGSERHDSYVVESHLYKLKTLPEDIIHTEKYNTNKELYRQMHEMKLLLRNYDMEIDMALMHFKDSNISTEDLVRIDFDNLLFKPYFLISRIVKIEKSVYTSRAFEISGDPLKQAICILISAHFNNIKSKFKSFSNGKIIHSLKSSLNEGVLKSLKRGVKMLTDMMKDDRIMQMNDILTKSNPFIEDDTVDFMLSADTEFKGTALEYFDEGKYFQAVTSNEFDAVQMLYYAIAIDLELERNTIKSLMIKPDSSLL